MNNYFHLSKFLKQNDEKNPKFFLKKGLTSRPGCDIMIPERGKENLINQEGKTKMTRQEINNRITEIESKRFYLAMKDRWEPADYKEDKDLYNEWLSLTYKTKAIDEN